MAKKIMFNVLGCDVKHGMNVNNDIEGHGVGLSEKSKVCLCGRRSSVRCIFQ